MRSLCRILTTSSHDVFSVRTRILQNHNKVNNFNTSLACNRSCSIVTSLCVPGFFQSCTDAVLHQCFTHTQIFFHSGACRLLQLPNSHINSMMEMLLMKYRQQKYDAILTSTLFQTKLKTDTHLHMNSMPLGSPHCGCLSIIANFKPSASQGPPCVFVYIHLHMKTQCLGL